MGNGIHISQKSKLRSHKQKDEKASLEIKEGKYIQDFMVALTFSHGEKKIIDFLPLFQKYVRGNNLKYFAPQNFKRFIIKNGNIYWGKNEDVIFPTHLYSNTNKLSGKVEEEILFVI